MFLLRPNTIKAVGLLQFSLLLSSGVGIMTSYAEICQLREEEDEEEEECFYDTREDILSASDLCQDSDASCKVNSSESLVNCSPFDQLYNLWVEEPASVQERRNRFKRQMGLSFSSNSLQRQDSVGFINQTEKEVLTSSVDRPISDTNAELRRSSNSEIRFSVSSWSSEFSSSSEDYVSDETFLYRFKNMDDGSVFVPDELREDGSLATVREVGANHLITADEFERMVGPSPFVQHFMRREDNTSISSTSSDETVKGRRIGWLKRLGVVACVADRQEENNLISRDADQYLTAYKCRAKVHSNKKCLKEFSAVYRSQYIQAHEGAILTMKFSPDGQYLATGGEDGIICVWHVNERDRMDNEDLPEEDPSCLYFMADHQFGLTPICMNKEKKNKPRGTRITSDSSCVVIPPKLFQLSEKPLHEFHGHNGEIIDLSWSMNKHIVSSSTDDTVRLWRVGCDSCVQVFPHNDFVTCVQFNPTNENCFISGCLDGKVRRWGISEGHVIDWVDVKDMVTAVCYGPDGNEVVVGSITGICRFYSLSDNHLELDAQLQLQGKKKSSGRMITGFQFCPSNPKRLMVTSADSRVRILDKFNVVCKYKGFQNSASRISASFTKDGKHIISASEDSHVYIWNYTNQNVRSTNHMKGILQYERFFSSNVSVAIPWHGLEGSKHDSVVTVDSSDKIQHQFDTSGKSEQTFSSFTLNQGVLSEVPMKGSATWPEEKLRSCSMMSSLGFTNSEKSLFKSSYEAKASSSHAWGHVIVTATWDGHIRSYQNYGLPVHF